MPNEPAFLHAGWRAPPGVRACTSLRAGGFSRGPWRGFNLGAHVGDAPEDIARNRALLRTALGLPAEPQWLDQVHGTEVAVASREAPVCRADAAWTDTPGVVCAVLTADCLPVVLASGDGREIAVAHCGWRGLAKGVLAATVARFAAPPGSLRAWLGPAIGPAAFEVGEDVLEAFLDAASARQRPSVEAAFVPRDDAQPRKYLADLAALARSALRELGVTDVSDCGRCTVGEPEAFFSYRRDGVTGRMATLAWIDPAQDSR